MGALASFSGMVRSAPGSGLQSLVIEHYPGMTEKAIRQIAEQALERWPIADLLVVHRHGTMLPGETIVLVATLSRHRGAAFKSAEFLMDFLKSEAPFWKKELFSDRSSWVDARAEDSDAMRRWQEPGASG